ncbi:DUF2262 domain-containing protein [Anabaena sp. FACHB-709]|uniref:DUF2262 domain-containing protein n=2 Tax=Nostocaceae TaxID=1162 RepID=A0A1Z4KSB6_ANAVA|nr:MULTISPECIES: DUF2262 domain-containing protein [Nostocaceae]BAY71896.1 hypothetical protein NIES23_47190 [Trichormus variabilis NIES-23]HBW33804.1 DUF2262 domain-containing protein [Nostoc sp. UBA8866]MBD2172198.1 DUF2262 domain-containing protein [Anabaena cylindrica FACHB-318]MBD2263981.1 DUF2262 domain-containing protein [Anabaena sp. FACHB-709]MBD2273139.1 DUF2262 domain-containing protein [Nostoc sp. PCC 7120 = FACHB-418]
MNLSNIKHEILGELRYDTKFDCYEGQVVFYETQLSISISIEDNNKLESILTRASSFVRHLKHYAKNAEEYAVKKLLELKNETWLDEDEIFLTPEDFKNRMMLEGLVFSPDGEVAFYYNDGNLFFGHCILITMDKDNCFIDAGISG